MDEWRIYGKKADFNRIAREFGISPVTARVIRNRDMCDMEEIRDYLYGTKEQLYSPFLMKDLEKGNKADHSFRTGNREFPTCHTYPDSESHGPSPE